MKLCPQCDFIYENDQNLCDMDGAALVHDPRPFPPAKNANLNPSANSPWWRFAATAVVGVVLGAVLLYQISIHPTTRQNSTASSAAQVTNNSAEQVTGDSALPAIDDSEDPANLDLRQSVPLNPPIDATPAPPPALPRKASLQSPGPYLQLPELSKASTKGNSSTPGAVMLSPSPSRSPASKRDDGKRRPAPDKPKAAHQKKDSSIGSFLKKTGQIFKKPFKL